MPLDQDLIVRSTTYSQKCFENLTVTESDDLWFINDFLEPVLLEKLLAHITSDKSLEWFKTLGQEHRPRREVRWQFDSVIEEVHVVVSACTKQMISLLGRPLEFNGIMIWHDTQGYKYSRHKDVPQISAALQVYLTEGDPLLNTKFYYKNQILESNYRVNQGYILDNKNFLEHGIECSVPANHDRYSLYAHWGPPQ